MSWGVRALTFLLLASACASEAAAPTRLVLVADTDIPELTSVRFVVDSPAGEQQDAQAEVSVGEPAWLVMDKSDGASMGPYQVRVEGHVGAETRVVRSALIWFQDEQTMTAPLHLVQTCVEPMCDGELVCSAEGCRDEALTSTDLTPWTGVPPTLQGTPGDGDDGDAGNDAGSPADGGADTPDGGSPCSEGETTCKGEEIATCEGGELVVRPCEVSSACTLSRCQGGACMPEPADEGEPCGSGLTCAEGVCGGGQACTSATCAPTCDGAVAACELDCGVATRCEPDCVAGQTCDIHCNDAATCLVDCQGACAADCGNSTNCRVFCSTEGASCDVTCQAAGCERVECTGGAKCVMRCSAGQDCDFKKCEGGDTTCPEEGVTVCNRDCP